MDRNQRQALAALLTNHAWYVNTTNGDHSNEEFEKAKAAFNIARKHFIECESSVVDVARPTQSKRLL
ncbi:hypothetical protein D3C75_1043280 [compost metagenome]